LIAPNPVSGYALIQFPNQGKNAEVSIYDVTGRLIRRWDRVPSEALSWNMAENAKGIYVIRVRSGGRTYRHKAVKMQ
ncbi:MAG: T9SS type A sorting domain-containing protein, partial [Deltaproteobacteria bacterium]